MSNTPEKPTTRWQEELLKPFPMELIELKPGATNKEKTKALAMPYADSRVYQERLDAVVGSENWMVSYEPWGADRVFCHLTVNGVTKTDVGEAAPKDSNAATIAVAQAFKRTCSAFGLGRYLYNLPTKWIEFDGYKFTGNVPDAIRWMYASAGYGVNQKPSNAPAQQPQATEKPKPVEKSVQQSKPAVTAPKPAGDLDDRIKGALKLLNKNDGYATKWAHDELGTSSAWQKLMPEQKQEVFDYLNKQLDKAAAA